MRLARWWQSGYPSDPRLQPRSHRKRLDSLKFDDVGDRRDNIYSIAGVAYAMTVMIPSRRSIYIRLLESIKILVVHAIRISCFLASA